MHETLRRIDLNLLLVFDALFRHRSVVAAANELSLSASACSHALSRLRGALDDELFVRYGSAMQPTVRAGHMASGVREALQMLTGSLGEAGPFKAATSRQTFVFAATDFTAFAVLPRLIAALERTAPHVRIRVVYSSERESLDELASGRVQFALGFTEHDAERPAGLDALDCFADDYVVAVRAKHPRIKKKLSLAHYLAERHVVVTPWSSEGSVIDAALLEQGHVRDVAVQLPSVMAAPFIVANSDMLLTLPRRAALQFADAASATALVLHATPFAAPPYRLNVFFHKRHASSPAHRWMREKLLTALNETPQDKSAR
ncbi:LysR family transcriptional regulator [Paraburkholderia acidisoli]|uniref:LysR family transcriptional regulator n=1 Tax=Paraburkholderia acidisoli TaxID=2571748 RepID=A0A7Z2JG62_9BURK|nr:LysR family transcriptional regulator [Paraburkholderia acidisoli]QGZ64207.1 LysR family transcriptional regulator [Paraburkholderia acidisoli]